MTSRTTLIIGANSSIGAAIAAHHQQLPTEDIILISRKITHQLATAKNVKTIMVKNYQANSIDLAIEQLKHINSKAIGHVYICNGILHNDALRPEKRLEDFNQEAFNQVMTANALTPILWLQKLTPILTGEKPCKVVLFSARVGSISDNQLGGWYSYRASKAALNMMIKTASIELARRAKNIKLIAFHPGTTDTALSKPFQHNVAKDKLFSSEFVATKLSEIVENVAIDQTVSYLDWQGKTIDW
ncbi:SDR family NAD(P)-dependent oxidoreductase [Paraglaciecola sp. L3A3]|uniref:SDR family NAD(P)-dependent oxidoreductase n=1 Tax=Paraglaciecola sp. L3A3 TaxID=2686358 RepID=UPI00131E7924|nr:SDR family NAD(P)-dependent oxidoreductase [Paraglaciecola sp. L3A3]